MPLAASNLTLAVTAHAQALEVFTAGIAEVREQYDALFDDYQDVPVDMERADTVSKRLASIVENMRAEVQVMNHLAAQMPNGSTAATTGAAQATIAGEAVGKEGTAEDETAGPATGPGVVPNEEIDGSGIIGIRRENIAPGAPQSLKKDEEKKEA